MTLDSESSLGCCEWIGHGEGCNEPRVPGRSYCEHHLWRVYQPGTALRKRKKDIKRAALYRDIESELNKAIEELTEEGVLP